MMDPVMRKILVLMLSLLVFASCGDKGEFAGPSADSPLAEWLLPSTARAGGEAVVQWNGFEEGARIFLVSGAGEYEAQVSVITASGLIFIVPADVPAGQYTVIFEQGERIEMGKIEIVDAEMPVSGLKVPSAALQGETVVVSGLGFDEKCVIVLMSEDVTVEVETALSPEGVTFVVPVDLAEAEYQVILVREGISWVLSSSFSVRAEIAPVVVKTLARIDYFSPYVGSAMIRVSWDIDPEDPCTLTVSEYVVDGEEESLEAYDEYVMNGDGIFELVHDGFEASNDLEMSYVFDESGAVTSSDVLIYGDSETTPFTWKYDADGFVTDISSPSRSFRSFSYEDGNMTVFRNTSFVYADPDLVNNPAAPDVVWGYMSLMEKNDPFVYVPYLTGWYRKASALLPTSMVSPSPTGTGTVEYPLSYEFDEDGYVTMMYWDKNKVGYFFE